MIESASSGQISLALVNAALLALWPVLPGLLFGYLRQAAAVRRLRPAFALRKSETQELRRAVQLYGQVRERLTAIKPDAPPAGLWQAGVWRNIRDKGRAHSGDAETLEDLQAHAGFLQDTIIRLQQRPLQRLKLWLHLVSAKTALGRALAAHVTGLVLLLIVFHLAGQSAWAGDLTPDAGGMLQWYPFDQRLFYANAAAAGFAAAAALVFYPLQRITLRREYACEYCAFRELARSEPGQTGEPAIDQDGTHRADTDRDAAWHSVLGLSPSATIDEVKEAYRSLIKQNHPDRVHALSPALQRLAASETQKLNAALRQGLLAASRPQQTARERDQAA